MKTKEIEMKIEIIETNLTSLFIERLKELSKKTGKNLVDDDILSDYMAELFKDFYKKTGLDNKDLNTLVMGNYFIQNIAFTPYDYSVIEKREVEKIISE